MSRYALTALAPAMPHPCRTVMLVAQGKSQEKALNK